MALPDVVSRDEWLAAGMLDHLRSRDTAYALVSLAPLARLQAYQASRGWTVPWYSSHGSDFNVDFQATLSPEQPVCNYQRSPDLAGDAAPEEVPGVSCFPREGGDIYHTYSTWARGTDILGSSYSLLDLTALGRQEDWEEPRGRAARPHGADPSFSD
ncbi:MAG: DUF899 family protein [Streptosporangiaceae bacterium]